jgi:hypothetical protein
MRKMPKNESRPSSSAGLTNPVPARLSNFLVFHLPRRKARTLTTARSDSAMVMARKAPRAPHA